MAAKKQRLTDRETVFLKKFIKTGNQTKAAIASGSPPAIARQCGWAMMKRIKGKVGEVLEAHGITPDTTITRVLQPGLEAMKVERISHQGITMETHEDIDHEQRGKYLDRVYKLTGLYGNGHTELPSGDGPSGPTVNLVFTDERTALAFAENIARIGRYSQQPALVLRRLDQDEGSPGSDFPIQANPQETLRRSDPQTLDARAGAVHQEEQVYADILDSDSGMPPLRSDPPTK
jgi:hypothetical protein